LDPNSLSLSETLVSLNYNFPSTLGAPLWLRLHSCLSHWTWT